MSELLKSATIITVSIVAAYYLYGFVLSRMRGKKNRRLFADFSIAGADAVYGEINVSCLLREKQEIVVELLDGADSLLETIVSGEKNVGEHSFTLNTTNHPNGVYYCRYKSATQKEIRKITIAN